MGKSSTNLEPPDCTLEQQACRATLVPQAAAAFNKPAPAVLREAVPRDLLEAALPLDGGLPPHQPVVPSLHGLGLSADRDCAGLAGGGQGFPIQHHHVGWKGEGLLLPAVDEDGDVGHPTILTISLRPCTTRPPESAAILRSGWTPAWWGPGSSWGSEPSG